MESADEGLDNIFEDRENEEANVMTINGESNNETSSGVKVQPIKRIVKNPRLKFNPERLCGERGIPIVIDHFKDVKFKGKGHEKEDLDKLLSKLEHWAHRLFPSMKFEDCLHQIEKLGKKRPVQTCLRKIRLDMPILNSDFVKDNEDDDVQRIEDSDPVEIDAFDRLVGENQNFNSVLQHDNDMDSAFSTFSPPSRVAPTYEPKDLGSTGSVEPRGGQVLGSAGSSLTEEQRERLERNRMLAIERRKARLAHVQQNAAEPLQESNERTSQENPIEQTLDSSMGTEMIMPVDSSTNGNHSHNNETNKITSLEIDTQNSDKLGLDDLVDLVDREELDSDKIANSPSEQSPKICVETTEELSQISKLSNFKQTMICSILDDNNSSMTAIPEAQESTENKNLGLDSLMDLINENSEECQQNSDSLDIVTCDSHDKNLMSEEILPSAMDYEDEK